MQLNTMRSPEKRGSNASARVHFAARQRGGRLPLTALAQQTERVRRIGVLLNVAADDPESLTRVTAFAQGLQELGWIDGRNVRIDFRWGGADVERIRRYAAELLALALEQATSTVPIVFVQVPDPVGSGHVESLARPGGNATGFATFEYGFGGKWLELLKEISPHLMRAAVLRDVAIAAGSGQFGAIQSMAPSLGVEISPVGVRDASEIERAVTAFARGSNGGLIVTGSSLALVHRDLIVSLAARYKLPAVYPYRYFATGGGLISYGPNAVDPFRRSAGYVDQRKSGAQGN